MAEASEAKDVQVAAEAKEDNIEQEDLVRCYNRKEQNSESNKKAVSKALPTEALRLLLAHLVLRRWMKGSLHLAR